MAWVRNFIFLSKLSGREARLTYVEGKDIREEEEEEEENLSCMLILKLLDRGNSKLTKRGDTEIIC